MQEQNAMRDTLRVALDMARDISVDRLAVVGFGAAVLTDEFGDIKDVRPFANLITTAGDEYYAKKGIAGIAPAAPAAPTAATGMKLGTGATAPTKSGAAAALGAYITGSNLPFDATFPNATAVGGDGGWNANYKTSWPAGTVTNAAIAEVVLVNDSGTNATSTAANTYARATFTAINKTASDSLAITWVHKFLGA